MEVLRCHNLADPKRKSRIQVSIISALAAMGPAAEPAIPALVGCFQAPDADDPLRITALRALGRVGPQAKATVPLLIESMSQKMDAVLADALYEALAGIGDDAVEPLINNLITQTGVGRIRTVKALGRIGPKAVVAVPVLEAVLQDPDRRIKAEAETALRNIRK